MSIRYKNFELNSSDSDDINKLLTEFPIAKGAHILLSDGKIGIPYEDGEEPTLLIKVLRVKELRNDVKALNIALFHEQRVAEVKAKGITEKIAALTDKNTELKDSKINKENKKEVYDSIKVIELEIKKLENVLDQTNNQRLMRQAGITDNLIEIAVYDEEITNLENEPNSNTTE